MGKLRLGYVKYLNTLPLVEGLAACHSLELVPAAPSALADMLASGQVDVALCSVIDAARSAMPLTLLPVGMIGCDGPTLTVRIFSAVPFDQVRQLHADTESHTSVALANICLDSLYGVRPELIDFDAAAHDGSAAEARSWPQTLLLIGDKVVTDCPPAEQYPHQLDLGSAWHQATGLPFVYAMWMCRTADLLAGGEQLAAINAAAALLDRQRRRNIMRTGWIIERYASERHWPRALARQYVTEYLRYDVGARERIAIARFFDAASALDLCPPSTPQFHLPLAVQPAVAGA